MQAIVAVVFLILPLCVDAAQRSHGARVAFMRLQPCPSTGQPKGHCPGYVIDHIKALACGGADKPENMQWQTIEEGKAKDRVERIGCSSRR